MSQEKKKQVKPIMDLILQNCLMWKQSAKQKKIFDIWMGRNPWLVLLYLEFLQQKTS